MLNEYEVMPGPDEEAPEPSLSLKQRAMVEALRATLGIVSTACSKVGISRETHYQWLRAFPDYKAEVDAVDEAGIDFAESKLFELMNGVKVSKMEGIGKDKVEVIYKRPPHAGSIFFYLKTKGKNRGYTMRHELSGPDGQALTPGMPPVVMYISDPDESDHEADAE